MSPSNPVDKRRPFNDYKTSIHQGRHTDIDLEAMLCLLDIHHRSWKTAIYSMRPGDEVAVRIHISSLIFLKNLTATK